MPIYEYKCTNCNNVTEHIRNSIDRDQTAICGQCQMPANRILSAFSITGNNNSPNHSTSSQNNQNHNGISGSITNCRFENCKTGISLPEGAQVTMKGNTFKDVKTPFESRKKN